MKFTHKADRLIVSDFPRRSWWFGLLLVTVGAAIIGVVGWTALMDVIPISIKFLSSAAGGSAAAAGLYLIHANPFSRATVNVQGRILTVERISFLRWDRIRIPFEQIRKITVMEGINARGSEVFRLSLQLIGGDEIPLSTQWRAETESQALAAARLNQIIRSISFVTHQGLEP